MTRGPTWSVVLVAACIVACAATPEGTIACTADRECPADVRSCRCDGFCWRTLTPEDPLAVRTYVIRRLVVAPPPTCQGAYGLDLDRADGATSTTLACGVLLDAVSCVTGRGAVDASLDPGLVFAGQLLGALDGFDGLVEDEVEGGTSIVLEVGPVALDPCARRVHAWIAERAAPAPDTTCGTATSPSACAMVGCVWRPSTNRCTGIDPGQTWTTTRDLGEVDATLEGGHLRTQAFALIPLAARGLPMSLPMHDVRMDLRLTDARLDGELGGAVSVGDLHAWASSFASATIPASAIESSVRPDLEPTVDRASCTAISVGLGVSAVSATRAP